MVGHNVSNRFSKLILIALFAFLAAGVSACGSSRVTQATGGSGDEVPPLSLEFGVAPSGAAQQGVALETFTVELHDEVGSLVTSHEEGLVLEVASDPAGVEGTLAQELVGGVAIFSGLSFSAPGTFVLVVTAGDLTEPLVSDAIEVSAPLSLTEEAFNAASLTSGGSVPESDSALSGISADGRFIVFESISADLVAGDTNGAHDVFVRDLAAGTLSRVSLANDGSQGEGPSYLGRLSANGRYVAFVSGAANLVSGDANNAVDVFVRDREAGTTELASVASDGTQGDIDSGEPAISADGRYVAFSSYATTLTAVNPGAYSQIYLRDRLFGTTTLVSGSGEDAGDSWSMAPSVSDDGSKVSFLSFASNLIRADGNGLFDVYVRDMNAGTNTIVSVNGIGYPMGAEPAYGAPISGDGNFVVYTSIANGIAGSDSNNNYDVFRYDLTLGTIERVAVPYNYPQTTGHAAAPSISRDGRYIAFESYASNMVFGDSNNQNDVFVKDMTMGTIARASQGPSGEQGDRWSITPFVSADGRFVGFASPSTNFGVASQERHVIYAVASPLVK